METPLVNFNYQFLIYEQRKESCFLKVFCFCVCNFLKEKNFWQEINTSEVVGEIAGVVEGIDQKLLPSPTTVEP